MPAICESINSNSKISENLSQSFKKQEKENTLNHLKPTAKQILGSTIEYEAVPSYTSPFLKVSSQSSVIVLKPNQPPLSNGKSPQNGKHHSQTSNGNSSPNQLPHPKRVLYPRDNVQVGWNNMSRNWSTGCGFNNIGNTCYLNSTLQAFFHVPALANWLTSDTEHREKGSCQGYQMCIICSMATTLLNTQKQHSSITPSQITNKLHQICKHLTLGRQEDAHEFLRYLVECMEKSFLNRFRNMQGFKEFDQYTKETTPLNQILGGYLRSTVTCLSCKHESVTFQHFLDLPLDISRVNTLNDALAGYFARENLEECDYKCESCKKKVSATKRFSLERAPVVLCIQLKRFNAMMGKLGKQIQISLNLDLQKHMKSGDSNQHCHYRLVSLVTHLGMSANGGHYTAIGLAPTNNYYQFDDSCVSSISTESVLRTNAYLLFYELTSNKSRSHSNGHATFSHTEHTYSKSALSQSSTYSSSSSSTNFAKPLLPSALMRQNIIKQKENETTPPSSKNSSSSLSNGKPTNGIVKSSSQLFGSSSSMRSNGHDSSDDEMNESNSNFIGPKQPNLPRLSLDDSKNLPPTPSTSSSPSSHSSSSPAKPKSLVPYETDDDDDEQLPSNSENGSMKKNGTNDSVNFLRTASGVFLETEVKENSRPSKEGSTVDRTIVTKASTTSNGTTKITTNGYYVKKSDDTLTQLNKLNHSGYGTSEVNSWNNTQSSMAREVDNDQREDRKRHAEDDDDDEMDMGRVKKVKYAISYPKSSPNHQGNKLPNPFQEQQNNMNQNGNNHNNPNNGYRHNNYNSNGFINRNSKYNNHNKFHNKHQNGYGGQNGSNNYHNKNFNKNTFNNHNNGNRKYFNKRR